MAYKINMAFLPISKEDMKERGIEQLDFVFVIGDAYVDHPSFGHAIISRVLDIQLVLFHSLIGRTMKALMFWENQDWHFW